MHKKIIAIFMLLGLVSVLAVACGGGDTSTTGSSGYSSTGSSGYGNADSTKTPAANASGTNEVHLAASSFAQTSITIAKGSKLTLVNDTAAVHDIENGSWDNNQAKPLKESSAPKVDTMFNGNDTQAVGPFTTAGTYHLFCTIHAGMNLTVIVQ